MRSEEGKAKQVTNVLLFSSVFVFSSFSQKLENPKLNRISKELNTLLYTVAVAVVAAASDVVAVCCCCSFEGKQRACIVFQIFIIFCYLDFETF